MHDMRTSQHTASPAHSRSAGESSERDIGSFRQQLVFCASFSKLAIRRTTEESLLIHAKEEDS